MIKLTFKVIDCNGKEYIDMAYFASYKHCMFTVCCWNNSTQGKRLGWKYIPIEIEEEE